MPDQKFMLFKLNWEEVYVSTTKSLIGGVISGYNATIFAYGPTGKVVPVAVLLQMNKI